MKHVYTSDTGGAEVQCTTCTSFSSTYTKNPYLQLQVAQRLAGASPVYSPQNEVQEVKLQSEASVIGVGTFKLSFNAFHQENAREETCVTNELPYAITATEMESALNMFCNFGTVSVSRVDTSTVSSPFFYTRTWSITFLNHGGGLNLLQPLWYGYGCSTCVPFAIDSTSNTNIFANNPGSQMIVVRAQTGTSGIVRVRQKEAGTRENAQCSNHGYCDTANGLCTCFNGFLSSDGIGNFGLRGDCGHKSAFPTPV